nr:MAG TPA: hypothetical protein [Caudoviricetes sp.]
MQLPAAWVAALPGIVDILLLSALFLPGTVDLHYTG